MEIHEAADIFPLDEEGLPALAEDIKAHGLLVPVERFEGKIIDGRRRLRACEMAGVEPKFRDVSPADPIAYAWSLNGPRRHLTPSQLAMVGARMRELYDRQAKERMSEGGKTAGKNRPKQGKENLPSPIPTGQARDAVGKTIGVSGRSIDFATRVLAHGEPELVKAVDDGRIAVSAAAVVATEPPEVQREVAGGNHKGRRVRKSDPPASGDEPGEEPDPDNNPEDRVVRGKGLILANEAINSLNRIPKNDALRSRGLQLVTDWIRRNK